MIGPKVTLELRRKNTVDDGAGTETTTWEGKRRIIGTLIEVTGDERLSADKKAVIRTHKFYIDFPVGITINEKDRFYYGEKILKIEHVGNIGATRNKELKITLNEET